MNRNGQALAPSHEKEKLNELNEWGNQQKQLVTFASE